MQHDEIPEEHQDPFLKILHTAIRLAVKILPLLMVLAIFWSIADVVYVLYSRLISPPFLLLDLEDILQVFGAFIVVLIGIENKDYF